MSVVVGGWSLGLGWSRTKTAPASQHGQATHLGSTFSDTSESGNFPRFFSWILESSTSFMSFLCILQYCSGEKWEATAATASQKPF